MKTLILVAVAILVLGAGLWLARSRPKADVLAPATAEPSRAAQIAAEKEQTTPSTAMATQPSSQISTSGNRVLLPSAGSYVGTDMCASCHAEQYQSYLETDHSRSLAEISARPEAPVGQYVHGKSRTTYQASRDAEGRMVHREWINSAIDPTQIDSDANVLTAELPVTYVMGSGAFVKSYLLRDGDFHMESPMNWYVDPHEFAMGPGYDVRDHLGMTRAISDRCMFCHAGSLELMGGNDEKWTVDEVAISCERCHGPGAEHADLFASLGDDVEAGKIADSRIVHPGHLDRDLADAICAQCHLQGDIEVEPPGKTIWDFRPGERLETVRATYKLDKGDNPENQFVDHFDQIWHSKCYLESDSMSCITCHDPHHGTSNDSEESVHQQYCAQCHDNDACGLPHPVRMERENNHCVRCHMPTSDSEVLHAATTHHRIGIHASHGETDEARKTESESIKDSKPSAQGEKLRRLFSPTDPLSASTTERNDRMAEALWRQKRQLKEEFSDDLDDRSLEDLLRDLIQMTKDAPGDHALQATIMSLASAEIDDEGESTSPSRNAKLWKIAEAYALNLLRLEGQPTMARKAALEVLVSKRFDDGDFAAAAAYGAELASQTRSAKNYYNLGLAYGRLRQFGNAEQAFKESIRIDGRYAPPYLSLYKLYQAVDPARAARLAERIPYLQRPGESEDQ